ncbi:MAG: hypothetical protein HQL95_03445 [Magnetococcales bacterium]|nr:hypothetical protein [Magnetococcales bacterium]
MQNCAALQSLKESADLAVQSGNKAAITAKDQSYNYVVHQYIPFFAAIMAGFHTVFDLEWFSAYQLLRMLGTPLICLAVVLLLRQLFGETTAGLTLMLLAGKGIHLPITGLSLVIPNNLAMAAAMGIWVAIFRYRERLRWWLPGLIALLISMHSLGQGWGALTLLFYALLIGWQEMWRQKFILCAGLTVIALHMFAVPFWEHPSLLPPYRHRVPTPDDKSYLDLLSAYLRIAQGAVANWIASLGSIFFWGLENRLPIGNFPLRWLVAGAEVGVLGMLGFYLLPADKKRDLLALLTAAGLFALVALLYVQKQYHPAEVFLRAWNIPAILLSGLFVHAMTASLARLRSGWGVLPGVVHLQSTIRLVMLLIMTIQLGAILVTALRQIPDTLVVHNNSNNYTLNPRAGQVLHRNARPCDTVLYTHPIPLLDLLIHGAMSCGAAYLPLFQAISPEHLQQRLPRITQGASLHPLVNLWNTGTLPVARRSVELSVWKPDLSGEIHLLLRNPGDAQVVWRLVAADGDEGGRFELAPQEERWFTTPHRAWPMNKTFRWQMEPPENPPVTSHKNGPVTESSFHKDLPGDIILAGIRLKAPNDGLFWPWDEGIAISFKKDRRPLDPSRITTRFAVEDTFSNVPLQFKPVSDRFATVLWEARQP